MAEKIKRLCGWAQCVCQIFYSHEGYGVRVENPRPTPGECEMWSPYQKLVISSYRREPLLVFMVANPGCWQELEDSLLGELMALGETPWDRRRGVIANGVLVRFYHIQSLKPPTLQALGDPSRNYLEDPKERGEIEKRLTFYKTAIQSEWLGQNPASP